MKAIEKIKILNIKKKRLQSLKKERCDTRKIAYDIFLINEEIRTVKEGDRLEKIRLKNGL